MTTRRPEHKPRRSSPLGMTGGIYRGSEAERYSRAVDAWRESDYDDQVMIDAGFWTAAPP